ncbi:MAG: hypothetical protein IAE88_12955, partial [Rhodobacteraceae bacterium]|nr:hypothetical protein [Paracoccaceae bacterium]
TLNIGWSQNANRYSNGASATGVLDTTQGALTAELAELNVGQTAGRGTADGTLVVGNGVTLSSGVTNVGIGAGATGTLSLVDNFTGSFKATTANLANGLFDFANNTLKIGGSGAIVTATFNLAGGLLTGNTVDLDSGGSFNYTGGRLDVLTFNGNLDENGGTLAAGDSGVGTTTVNGDYRLSDAGTLEINLAGAGAGVGYDQLVVNGSVDLNGGGTSGGMLDLILDFAPQLNDSFVIISNDDSDAISGDFAGLAEGGSVQASYGGQIYSFAISYAGGDGNDVELTVTNIVVGDLPLLFGPLITGSLTASTTLTAGVSQAAVTAGAVQFATGARVALDAPAFDTPDVDAGQQLVDSGAAAAAGSDMVRFDGLLAALGAVGAEAPEIVVAASSDSGIVTDLGPASLAEMVGAAVADDAADAADAADRAEMGDIADDGGYGALYIDAGTSTADGLPALPLTALAGALSLGYVDFLVI